MTVQALFVESGGIYPQLLTPLNCWTNGVPDHRDAREYKGPDPVVAHPPCGLWTNMAAVNYARALKEPNRRKVLPAWYPGGDDGGCFASALASVRRYGGVLEHPAHSHAWAAHGLTVPEKRGWEAPAYIVDNGNSPAGWRHYWTCRVYQSAYNHPCKKDTWILYCGIQPPFELDWSNKPATHQIGWFDRKKPTLSKRLASATPIAFAQALIALAKCSRGMS